MVPFHGHHCIVASAKVVIIQQSIGRQEWLDGHELNISERFFVAGMIMLRCLKRLQGYSQAKRDWAPASLSPLTRQFVNDAR